MLIKHEYDILFANWKNQYGTEVVSAKGTTFMGVPVSSGPRREMLTFLVGTLIEEYGYTEQDFGALTCNTIVEACVWPEYPKKENLRKWREAAKHDLLHVLAETYPKKFSKAKPGIKESSSVQKEQTSDIVKSDEAPMQNNAYDIPEESRLKLSPKSTLPTPMVEEDTEFLQLLERIGK